MRKCPICYRKYAFLEAHMKEAHEGSRKQSKKKKKTKKKPYHKPVFVCGICSKTFSTQRLLDQHIDSEHAEHAGPSNYGCTMCAAYFETTSKRDIHLSMEHPKCRICDIRFNTNDEYLRHNLRIHPTNARYEEGILSTESEELTSDEEQPNFFDVEKRLFHKHIDCVTVDKFMEIRELIDHNQFDTLANDQDLLEALQIIFRGVLKGFLPLCSPQRLVMTRPMKKLMYTFGRTPSSTLLMRNKKNLKQLFMILRQSIDLVINSFVKYT